VVRRRASTGDPDVANFGRLPRAYAERDAQAPPDAAHALEARLRALGRRGAVRIAPGVSAGFLDAGRHAAFDASAAAEAWDVVLGFLRAELV
jgi:dienelactone hydrolase